MAGHMKQVGENKWKFWVSAGFGTGKKRNRFTKTVQAKSELDASKKLALFVAEVEKNENPTSKKTTFEQFTAKWRELHAKKLAAKTQHEYNYYLDERILPAIGHLRLDRLRPTHLLEFYEQLREPGARNDGDETRPLSEQTIMHYHRLIHSMLEIAVQWQYLPNNVAKRIAAPVVPDREMVVYTQDQVRAMMDKLEGEPLKYWLGVMIPLTCGLREGEVMGLEWVNIDLETGVFKVVKSSQYLPGKGTFEKTPKTRAGLRGLRFPAFVLTVLKEHHLQQAKKQLKLGDKWQKSGRVMTTWNGRAMYAGTLSQWFPAFIKRHKLDYLNYHGLRHTFATLMDRSAISDADLSRLLGHTRISTTKNLYTHPAPGADEQAAIIMDDMLNPKKLETKSS